MSHASRKRIKSLAKCNFTEIHEFYKRQAAGEKRIELKGGEAEAQRDKRESDADMEISVLPPPPIAQELRPLPLWTVTGNESATSRSNRPACSAGRGSHPKMAQAETPGPTGGRPSSTVAKIRPCRNRRQVTNGRRSVTTTHHVRDKIRSQYRADFKSKRCDSDSDRVALYLFDKLGAQLLGNENDDDDGRHGGLTASLRYEHINTAQAAPGARPIRRRIDFLGKDSIRYNNAVAVEKRGDDLFDRLNTSILNATPEGADGRPNSQVFRTYNASKTLEDQLEKLTNPDERWPPSILATNRANREVAILCKPSARAAQDFEKSMENLSEEAGAIKRPP
uniref:DNA topoisomerase n=1 Tax=Macrostomum lignano TaxID=282301 RepID=A0A1I8JRG2_9PLAT